MDQGIRINKYLSDAGICSRRQADQKVEKGEVEIDGTVALVGARVQDGQTVTVNGKTVHTQNKVIMLVFNKPVGIVCTTQKKEKDNIVDYINYPQRIYPVGRLDKDSQGLILLTNNGDIVNKIMRAGNRHEKEYIVTVNKDLTPEFLKGMADGVPILDTVTRSCKIEKLGRRKFRMILTQGMNRQIRRMCEAFDYRVVALKRVRIMNIRLGDLKEGTYRELTAAEWGELTELIKDSSNNPVSYFQNENDLV